MTHIIRKYYIHAELSGSEDQGKVLQNQLSELCRQRALPALEHILDRFSTTDQYLFIEHLEIDAGAFSIETISEDLVKQIESALTKALQGNQFSQKTLPTRTTSLSEAKTEAQSFADAFVYFLKFGYLPWWFLLPKESGLEEVLTSVIFTRHVSGSKELLTLNETLNYATARTRLVKQFSAGFLTLLLTRLSKHSPDTHLRHWMEIHLLLFTVFSAPFARTMEHLFWEDAFDHVVLSKKFSLENILTVVQQSTAVSADQKQEFFSILKKNTEIPGTKLLFTEEVPTALASQEVQIAATSDLKNLEAVNQEIIENEGVYIENAGLVLLHPFLPHLFEGLALSKDGHILQVDKALNLLHYLCTGKTPAPEYVLLLPKLLCGISPDVVPDLAVIANELEMQEANALLKAVIGHWTTLRDTSADALRGTFLTRAGKLSVRQDGDWLLQVERQSFDILLDSLPWSFSMIRLPWMQKMLWVEWG